MSEVEPEKRALVGLLDRATQELTSPGASFELTNVAVGGYQMKAYRSAPVALDDIWSATRCFGGRDYLVFENERVTYAEAHRAVDAIANWLLQRGIRNGDPVAIYMRNYPEWMLIFWAAMRVGAVVVGMNGWWTAEEAEHGLSDTRPRVIFCDAERCDRLLSTSSAREADVVLVRGTERSGCIDWNDVVGTEPGLVRDAPRGSQDDVALIYFTSGTTGRAKGAQLTHRGCINTMMSIEFNAAVGARIQAWRNGLTVAEDRAPAPVAMVPTPLFHVTANPCLTLPITRAGGTIILLRKWDPETAAGLIARERVGVIYAVPTQVRELARLAREGRHDLSSLAILSGGGAAMQADLVLDVARLSLPVVPSTGYGMTETCGAVTALTGPLYTAFPHSVGRPVPTIAARIVDGAGDDVQPGAPGELVLRGVSVIKGYINAPEATARTIVDGWLHTGDIARIDEYGFIEIVDRIKDMVIRGGENIYCAEVEAALYRIDGVAEASVFGVADARLGEEVGAAIFFSPGAPRADATALRKAIDTMIARHKVPRYIWILPEPLPRNAAGKIVRRELQAALLLEHAE